ncbi:MAG TPA: chemotaxis protein CheW, partial [bacterium]|nr:chemotaxis protein CheW [bacterium]
MKDFIHIKINQIDYYLKPEKTKEIIKLNKIIEVPNCNEKIIGITNYRGNPIPVFNTAAFLTNNTMWHFNPNQKIIIANILKENIAFVIDSVDKIIELDEQEINLNIDYSSFKTEEIINKIQSSQKDIYFFNITIFKTEMAFLRLIICIDILKNAGNILCSLPSIEDIENDNLISANAYFLVELNNNNINLLEEELLKVSDVEKI